MNEMENLLPDPRISYSTTHSPLHRPSITNQHFLMKLRSVS